MSDPRNSVPASAIPDLGALKGRNSAQARQNRNELLMRNGLLCPCGKLVSDGGVTLFLATEGIFPTEQGPQPGFALGTIVFHSRECPDLIAALEVEDPKPICIREFPRTEWIDEGILNDADNGDRPE